jgi:hypothetical protein
MFNNLHSNKLELQENEMLHKSTLRKYLLTLEVHSVEEFLVGKEDKINNFITRNII